MRRKLSCSSAGRQELCCSNLNSAVRAGAKLWCLLGRSGSGKTTTMKLINRLIDPTAGEVRVEGKPTVEWDPIRLRRRIGYVIQEIGLFPHLTVEENIGVVPRLEGWAPERIRERARALLTMVGLDADRFADAIPARVVRRATPAHRRGAGAGRRSAGDSARRAVRRPRSDHPARNSTRVQNPATGTGQDDDFRHPRYRRSFRARQRASRCSKTARWFCSVPPADLLRSQHPEARAFAECFTTRRASGAARDVAANSSRTTRGELWRLTLRAFISRAGFHWHRRS